MHHSLGTCCCCCCCCCCWCCCSCQVACRAGCGEEYCCAGCEAAAWEQHHCLLCTRGHTGQHHASSSSSSRCGCLVLCQLLMFMCRLHAAVGVFLCVTALSCLAADPLWCNMLCLLCCSTVDKGKGKAAVQRQPDSSSSSSSNEKSGRVAHSSGAGSSGSSKQQCHAAHLVHGVTVNRAKLAEFFEHADATNDIFRVAAQVARATLHSC